LERRSGAGVMPYLKPISKLLPGRWMEEPAEGEKKSRYGRLWRYAILLTAFVSIAPLVTMTAVSYYQYRRAFQDELNRPLLRLTSSVKRSIEFFLEERRAAMQFINNDKSFEELSDRERLGQVFRNMREAFGGFIDLGLIDSTGIQRAYVGPYELQGMNYKDQDWFHEVRLRNMYVSDVFMGYRNFPHFVIAVKHEKGNGDFYVLRATMDMEVLHSQIQSLELMPASDAIIINREGILQTPSRWGAKVLNRTPFPVPPYSDAATVTDSGDDEHNPYLVGYAYIERSPFIFMVIKRMDAMTQNWNSLRNRLVAFISISVVLILLLITGSSTYMVYRLREADRRQAKALHQLEYANKMASIGRLGAGVAHEINNPLAIINEKAGLIKDLLALESDFPKKDKLIKLIDSVLNSVSRCSTITHRLLGFAKHIDIRQDTIDLYTLLNEVLSFLDKEASYRNIKISISVPPDFPTVVSDRGQLQQVFLNIINNAFEALQNGGRIMIILHDKGDGTVEITISDTGPGIPKDILTHIFEPFFSTKKEHGTGLGLSITYGIMEKLGGHVDVISEVGNGTSFILTLPVNRP
jgi:two-component system NtrC family sensor kinase